MTTGTTEPILPLSAQAIDTSDPVDLPVADALAYEADRGAVFAAQFALSHACWPVNFPPVGWIISGAGLSIAGQPVADGEALGLVAVLRIWPADDEAVLPHNYKDLPPDHPHLSQQGARYAHSCVIEILPHRWSRSELLWQLLLSPHARLAAFCCILAAPQSPNSPPVAWSDT